MISALVAMFDVPLFFNPVAYLVRGSIGAMQRRGASASLPAAPVVLREEAHPCASLRPRIEKTLLPRVDTALGLAPAGGVLPPEPPDWPYLRAYSFAGASPPCRTHASDLVGGLHTTRVSLSLHVAFCPYRPHFVLSWRKLQSAP